MNERTNPILAKAIMMIMGIFVLTSGFGQVIVPPNPPPVTMSCNDNIQLSLAPEDLDGDGIVDVCGVVYTDEFLDGPSSGLKHLLEVNGALHPEATIGGVTHFDVNWVQYIGQTVDYKIIDAETSNSCWGTATVEANVFSAPALPCQYVKGVHETVEVKIAAGDPDGCETVSLTAKGITFDACQTPVVKADGDAKYPCDAGDDGIMGTLDDGWCTADCTVTYDPATNSVDVCLVGSVPVPDEVICTIKVTADECIDCETWCPDASAEMSEAEMSAFLNSSCFTEINQIFKKVSEFGDPCTGLTRIVAWSAMVSNHGEETLVDIGTQAFKISPLSLFVDGATGSGRFCNIYDPASGSGSGILILPPAEVSMNCDGDPSDLSKTGQPLVVNHHKTVTTSKFNCIDVHYIEVVDIIEDSPTLIDGVWVLATKVIKAQKTEYLCSPDAFRAFFGGRYNPGGKAIGDIIEILTLDALNAGGWPSTSTTGPEILTFEQMTAYECNTLLSSYTDQNIPACGIGYKVLRTWTLVDWCTTELKNYDQLIEVIDKTAPTIDKDPTEVTLSIEPWTCVANISTADPGFTDNCNDYTLNIEVTDLASGIWFDASGGLPVGDYTVEFVAVDACGNESKPYVATYHIVDHVKPVAVCEDELVVSLTDDPITGEAIAKILASDFDAGSHDGGCGPISEMKVIRMDHLEGGLDCDPFTEDVTTTTTDKFGVETSTTTTVATFGPHVKFCCNEPGGLVVLRVYDGYGNFNDCMVQVTVQNKLAANLTCTNQTIICTEYTGDPTDFGGVSTGGAECAPADITELDPVVDINSCGVGSIIRTFTLANGQLCQSVITVTGDGAFDPTTIRWPMHFVEGEVVVKTKEIDTRAGSATEGECIEVGEDVHKTFNLDCGDDVPSCEPHWTADACGLVGVSYTDEQVEFDETACYKIIRRWTVVDWCTWDVNDGSENLDDENDTDRDTFYACSDWCTDSDCKFYYRYDNVDEDGYYTFDQIIKVVDSEAPTVSCTVEASGIGADCTGSITFSADGADGANCPSQEIGYSWVVKNSAGATVASGVGNAGTVEDLTSGTYLVHFTATDGCGNSGDGTCSVDLLDGKAPTPYCLAISTAVMNNGQVEIWASDFIQKGEDNCTPEGDLIASFSGDAAVPNLLLTCADVTGDAAEVRVYLWDGDGNADFCVQTIRVDSNGHCDDNAGGGDDGNTGGGDDGNTGGGDDGNTGGNDGCPDTEGGVLLTDPTDLTELTICAGDGVSDSFDAKVWENVGDGSWLITDTDGNILDIPAGPPFDFDGAGEGVCLVWHVSSSGELTGVEVGANAADIGGCYSLSNSIVVTRVSSGAACDDAAGNALIAGNISTEGGEFVADAEVLVSNNVMPEYPITYMSSELTGNYAFMSNPMNYDYALSATKNNDFTNGVSTLDLVLIQKHILGLKTLSSPYKVIAADVNADQRVTASDLVQLRQLILGSTDQFDSNQSWRFVDASQSFENSLNPWPFTEVIDIAGLEHAMVENFVGVKIGDVTGDARANNFVTAEVRSNGNLTFAIQDAEVTPNEVVSVEVTSENFSEIYGFQFTMQHTGLELVDIIAGAINVDESNVGVREGMLTMSWNNTDGVTASEALFTLNFKATSAVKLSNAISLNSRITTAEAYANTGLEHNDVNLEFNTGETTIVATGYDLYQNEPNPFTANTNISFVLPQSEQATISIYDVTGKVVRVFKGQYAKGLNTINLNKDELGAASGILYYQLSSGEFTATKKMIIIE